RCTRAAVKLHLLPQTGSFCAIAGSSTRVRQILRAAKLGILSAAHRTGVLDVVRDSRWRQKRLLILGYHGVSLEDEHEWNPELYMAPSTVESQLTALERGGSTVLRLGEALAALDESRRAPRVVAPPFGA